MVTIYSQKQQFPYTLAVLNNLRWHFPTLVAINSVTRRRNIQKRKANTLKPIVLVEPSKKLIAFRHIALWSFKKVKNSYMECCCADDTGIDCGAEMTVGGINDELTGVALLLTVFVVRRGVRVEVTELEEHEGASNTDGEPPSPPPGELLVLGIDTDAAADAKDAAIDAADGIPPPEFPLNTHH